MITEQMAALALYHRQMNQNIYDACGTLDETVLKEDAGLFFKSIFGTLNHMLLTDRMWFSAFNNERVAYGSLAEELYGDFSELRLEREYTDKAIGEWVLGLTGEMLAGPTNERMNYPLWLTVTHFFNHQTHHRGQITAVLSQHGVDYGITDMPWVPGVYQR